MGRKQTLILFKKCIYPKEPSSPPRILYYGIVTNKAPYGVNLPYVKGQPFLNQTCFSAGVRSVWCINVFRVRRLALGLLKLVQQMFELA